MKVTFDKQCTLPPNSLLECVLGRDNREKHTHTRTIYIYIYIYITSVQIAPVKKLKKQVLR